MPLAHRDPNKVLDPTDTVLLSGGIDSATALALAVKTKRSLSALFVDYGQPAAASESAASVAVALHYQVPHRKLRTGDLKFGSGEILGRNAFLLHLAILASANKSGALILAIHSGIPYRDCNIEFVNLMQQSLNSIRVANLCWPRHSWR
jgi:7-cyano-7-deazaguanine synthase